MIENQAFLELARKYTAYTVEHSPELKEHLMIELIGLVTFSDVIKLNGRTTEIKQQIRDEYLKHYKK